MQRLFMLGGLAVRNVYRQKRRSLLTLAAIAASVVLMFFSRSVANGLERSLVEEAVLENMGAIQVHQKGFVDNVARDPLSFRFDYTPQLRSQILSVPGVIAASARIPFAAMLSNEETSIGTPLLAFDAKQEYAVCPKRIDNVAQGGRLARGGSVLSPALFRRLGARLGSELIILGNDFEGVMNAAMVTTHAELRDLPLLSMNPKMAYISLDVAQSLLRIGDGVLEVAIAVEDYQHPDATKAELARRLGDRFEVHTWLERNKKQAEFIAQRKQIFQFISGMFLVLALIGIANTMLMNVLGRTREIGTMMALGVNRASLRGVFVFEAMCLGLAGALLGALCGVLLVMFLSSHGMPIPMPGKNAIVLHPSIELDYVFKTVGAVVLGTLMAALYPAHRATKLTPIEALGAL